MATKTKTIFRCQDCGYSSPKWMGKCPDCGKWNGMVEERQSAEPAAIHASRLTDFSSAVQLLSEVSTKEFDRARTGIGEFDRMIGGGLVPGSLVLLGGAPGIGKSTLMLQLASRLAQTRKVLYVSGEESQEQVKARADRLAVKPSQLYMLSETSLENILEAVNKVEPEVLVIDSIQTTYRADLSSAPGSVGQVRECAAEFLRLGKSRRMTVFLLGHVTKEGDLAGPRVLEHIVDTVLYFESDRHQTYRILRAYKNRFGPTSEIGIFEMKSTGLEEVANPSQMFLQEHRRGPGSAIVATMEGSRPILLEIQALVSRTYFGLPRRQVTGVDLNRVLLIIAVLEKRLGMNLSSQDVFVNVTGGAKLREPAIDLGIACAVASAFGNFTMDKDGVLIGEVGLGGEIRNVSQVLERLKESERLGLSWAAVPKRGLKEKFVSRQMQVKPVETLEEVVRWMKDAGTLKQEP
jgi:DNA repair protein RadA/Sms